MRRRAVLEGSGGIMIMARCCGRMRGLAGAGEGCVVLLLREQSVELLAW